MNGVEEATVDELAGDNGFVAVVFGERVTVLFGKGELVVAEALQFSEVVVAGIGTGEVEAGISFNSEIEFGGELKVDELAVPEVAEEEVEFANGGVGVASDLEISGQEIVIGRGLQKDRQGVLVEIAEFLLKVQRSDICLDGEMMVGKGPGFRKFADEERPVDKALKECV